MPVPTAAIPSADTRLPITPRTAARTRLPITPRIAARTRLPSRLTLQSEQKRPGSFASGSDSLASEERRLSLSSSLLFSSPPRGGSAQKLKKSLQGLATKTRAVTLARRARVPLGYTLFPTALNRRIPRWRGWTSCRDARPRFFSLHGFEASSPSCRTQPPAAGMPPTALVARAPPACSPQARARSAPQAALRCARSGGAVFGEATECSRNGRGVGQQLRHRRGESVRRTHARSSHQGNGAL